MRLTMLLCFAFLALGTPVSRSQEKPRVAGVVVAPPLRLSDQQVQAAAANIDGAWEQVFHARWRRDSEMDRRYNRPVNPETPFPPEASDEVFLRRATLDATGLIPTEIETRAFLNDPFPDKRHRLVERLLLSPAWGRQQFNRYADLFRLKDVVGGVPQAGYIALLRSAAEANVPFDVMIKDLLTASGTVADNPATGFLLRDEGNLLVTMDHIAGTLLRTDAHCAMCHDHPFSDMTQRQFYELSACFGATQVTLRKPANPVNEIEVWPGGAARSLRLGNEGREGLLTVRDGVAMGLRLGSDYKYRDGKPGDLVKKAVSYPMGRDDPKQTWTSPSSLRAQFAGWLVSSRRFAEATAFAQMVALFDRSEAPVSFPVQGAGTQHAGMDCYTLMQYVTSGFWELLGDEREQSREDIALKNLLAVLVQRVHFDLREFQRVLMHTKAYGREANHELERGYPAFSRPPARVLRRLAPEEVWDTLVSLGGLDGKEHRFASELPQTLAETHPLRILGRGERIRGDDAERRVSPDVVRLMMNHEVARRIMNPESVLLSSLNMRFKSSPLHQAEALFLAILNRMPDERERAQAIGTIASGADGAGHVAWSLLNTSEFLFER